MQCVEKRHSAKRDYTKVYAYHPDKHTARSTFNREGQRASCPSHGRRGFNTRVWRAHNLLTLAWTSRRTLNKRGSGCLIFFFPPRQSLLQPTSGVHVNHVNFIPYPSKPQEPAPVCTDVFHSMWLMDLETVISILTRCIFIFSCVISNQCLGGADLCPKVASAVNVRDWHISKCI